MTSTSTTELNVALMEARTAGVHETWIEYVRGTTVDHATTVRMLQLMVESLPAYSHPRKKRP